MKLVLMYRWRVLRRNLSRSAARLALLSLTVGPAAVVALLAGRVSQESLTVPNPEQVAMIGSSQSGSTPKLQLTYGDLKRLQEHEGVLSDVAAIQTTRYGGPAVQFDYFDGEFTIRLIG